MTKKVFIQTLLCGLVLFFAIPFGAFAQDAAPPAAPQFKQEELEQMLAPIALYPDSLLVQILMASTYPLEIVEAARWAKTNQSLKGDQLTAALEKQNWDPSIKSLINFPSVLAMMNDKLEWTQKLGDAFLAQEKGVMDTVQKLRAKAQAQGMLKSTDQQKVTTQEQTIIIEPASPQVVYVPAYNPEVVYGPWMYPAYPPYPYYPPGAVIGASAVSFGLGVAVGAAWGYAAGSANWNHGNVNVNVNQSTSHNTNVISGGKGHNTNVISGGGGSNEWHHDPNHRGNVPYSNPSVAQKYGQPGGGRGSADARNDYRGHTPDNSGRSSQASGRQGSAGAFDGMNRGGSEAKTQSDRGRESSHGMGSERAGGGGFSRGGGGGFSRGGGRRR